MYFLFFLFFCNSQNQICIPDPSMDAVFGLIPRDEYTLTINSIQILVTSRKDLSYDTVQAVIPKSYEPLLEYACESKFDIMMKTYFPEDYFKTEELKEQLKTTDPENIPYFNMMYKIVKDNEEKVSSFRYWSPVGNVYEKLRQSYQKEYNFVYMYQWIPKALHQFYQVKPTGRSYEALLLRDGNEETSFLVREMKPSPELPFETVNRLVSGVSNIIENHTESTSTRNGSIERIHYFYTEINHFEGTEYEGIQAIVNHNILKWISKPIDIHLSSTNVFGIPIPILYKEMHEDKETIYINRQQGKEIIRKINRMSPTTHIIIFLILIVSLIFTIASRGRWSQKLFFVLFVFAFLLVWPINFRYFYPRFLGLIDWLFSFSYSKERRQVITMIEKENQQIQGRLLFRNMLKNAIPYGDRACVIKIQFREREGFEISSIYEFNYVPPQNFCNGSELNSKEYDVL